jgi:hypothetical protein
MYLLNLLGNRSFLPSWKAAPRRPRVKLARDRYFRPCMEEFEGRWVPAAPVFSAAHVAHAAAAASNINITGVNLTNFQVVNGILQATGTVTGTLAGAPFTTAATFALTPVTNSATNCAILSLDLQPIHISLLGLHVDTSPICLDVTATEGGGLLGNLLCDLANGGLGGTGLPTIPLAGTLSTLEGDLTNLLNGVLNSTPAAPGQGNTVCTGQCEVLDLTLGPLNLSLLGLNVNLDNCNNGPVEVCISATSSEGLLGSVLCSLADSNANITLAQITHIVSALL